MWSDTECASEACGVSSLGDIDVEFEKLLQVDSIIGLKLMPARR